MKVNNNNIKNYIVVKIIYKCTLKLLFVSSSLTCKYAKIGIFV